MVAEGSISRNASEVKPNSSFKTAATKEQEVAPNVELEAYDTFGGPPKNQSIVDPKLGSFK